MFNLLHDVGCFHCFQKSKIDIQKSKNCFIWGGRLYCKLDLQMAIKWSKSTAVDKCQMQSNVADCSKSLWSLVAVKTCYKGLYLVGWNGGKGVRGIGNCWNILLIHDWDKIVKIDFLEKSKLNLTIGL